MRRPVFRMACAAALAIAVSAASARAQRSERDSRARTGERAGRGTPEVRSLVISGVHQVDRHDLKKSIYTQASRCRSIVLEPFCLVSTSPTFEDKYYFDETEFRRDVIRIRLYYWLRGYRETSVDTSVMVVDPGKVKVMFRVTEGPATRVRTLQLSYDTTLIAQKVRDRLTLLHPGDPLDLIRLDSMRVMFQNELWNKGYGDAVVDTATMVDEASREADVSLTLTPNRRTTVERILILGNQKVSDRTIRNLLTFTTGDLYRLSNVLESQRNLYESNLFRLAAIGVPPQHDSAKIVHIEVTEAPMHEAHVGPGLNSLDFLQFQAHYTDYNFLGRARRLDVDGTIGNLLARQLSGHAGFRDVAEDTPDSNRAAFLRPTYTATIDFKQPAVFRPSDAFAATLFAHRSLNPGVFVDQGFGGQVAFTHEIRPRAPISIAYRFEQNRVLASDTYFCVNYGVCDTLTIGALRTHRSLSPATLTGFVDRSDAPFSPTRGYVARVDFEFASRATLSDFRYSRLFIDAAAYGHRSGTRPVYSAHLRFGIVSALGGGPPGTIEGVLHPRKRFYAGGANSVRGFAENQLGPRILTIDDSTLIRGARSVGGGICGATVDDVKFCDPNTPELSNGDFLPQPLGGTTLLEGSVEYRTPLGSGEALRHFVGAIFIDAGLVGAGDFRGFESIAQFIHTRHAITPGIGIRYQSGIGPIRLDVGFNPRSTETLGVVTTVRDRDGRVVIAPLAVPRRFFSGRGIFDRFVFHFSIGEAY